MSSLPRSNFLSDYQQEWELQSDLTQFSDLWFLRDLTVRAFIDLGNIDWFIAKVSVFSVSMLLR